MRLPGPGPLPALRPGPYPAWGRRAAGHHPLAAGPGRGGHPTALRGASGATKALGELAELRTEAEPELVTGCITQLETYRDTLPE